MPLLAGLIQALIGALAAMITREVSKRATVAVLAGSAISVSMLALVATFNLTVKPLVATMFSTQYGQFIGLAFPPIAGTCLAAIAGTWAACGLYKLKVATIKASAGT